MPEASTTQQAPAASSQPSGGQRRGGQGRGGQGQGRGTGGSRGFGGRGAGGQGRGDRRGRGRGRGRDDRPRDEFESTIIDLARVTRVMAGGKRMNFRACVIVGDKKGRIGMGVMKGADVQLAVAKATEQAKKHLIRVPIVRDSIPHTVEQKYKGARVMLKPAKQGTGIIAGGPTRIMMDLVGIKNIVAKMKGSGNKISNVRAVLEAFASMRTYEQLKSMKQEPSMKEQ